jgi:hypothetical protein
MKKINTLMSAGLVLAAVFSLILLGCRQEPEEDNSIDSRLVASWANGLEKGLYKEFTINEDGTFTAYINPFHVGTYNAKVEESGKTAAEAILTQYESQETTKDANTRWTVIGKLEKDEGDGVYLMTNLEEKTEKPANYKYNSETSQFEAEGSANDAVKAYSGKAYVITAFPEGVDNTFEFLSASGDEKVNAFFGGTYTKKE